MKYEIDQKVKDLSLKIKAIKNNSKNQQKYFRQIELDSQNSWNVKQLIIELLYSAEIKEHFNKDQLMIFQDEYNNKNGKKIVVENLLKKFWIGFISTWIIIPDQIRHTFYYFRQKDKKLPEFVKNNFDELHFLYELQKQIGYIEEQLPFIKKEVANKIIKKHKNAYTKCPTLEGLVKVGLLKNHNDDNYVIIYNHNNYYSQFKDEIFANLLYKIVENSTIDSFEEKICIWISKTVNFYWTLNLKEFFGVHKTMEVIEVATKLIEKEDELIFNSSQEQITKWCLKSSNRDSGYIQEHFKSEIEINNNSFYELFSSLQSFNNRYHLLSYQDDNYSYFNYLIEIVISNDLLDENNTENSYKYTIALLKNSKNKPFIFWKVLERLRKAYPEILPYLILDKELASISLESLLVIELNQDFYAPFEREEKKVVETDDLSKLWLSCFKLYLDFSVSNNLKSEEISKHLSQIFRPIILEAFATPNSNYYQSSLKTSKIAYNRYRKAYSIMTSYDKTRFSHEQNMLFDRVISSLYESFVGLVDNFQTKVFKVWKYDFLLELIKTCKVTENKKNDKKPKSLLIINDITQRFCEDFSKELRWDSNLYRLEDIEWHLLFINAYEIEKLDNIFNIKLKVDIELDEENRYGYQVELAKKIRLYLRILLIAFNKFINNKEEFKNKGVSVDGLQYELQKKITKVVCDNLIVDKEIDNLSLFDHLLESYSREHKIQLLNEFAETINHFSIEVKEQIFDAFIKTKQALDKLLILFNNLESERDRDILKRLIEKENAETFINEASWLPIIESGLIEALNSGVFSELAEKILDYYEKQINAKDNSYVQDKKVLIFRLKLFVAYKNKSMKSIDELKLPSMSHAGGNNLVLENQKYFFKALIQQDEKKYKIALDYFNQICDQESENIEFHLRRLILRCDIIQEVIDENLDNAVSEIQDIYDELNIIELKIIEIQENKPAVYINEHPINYLKAFCFVYLGKYTDFDYLYYNKLSYVERMNKGFLEFAMERCINDNLGNKAYELLYEAVKFHKLDNHIEPDFIIKIRKKLTDSQIIPDVKKLFEIMLLQESKNRINSIPKVINPNANNFGDFLLYEICMASKDLLSKISTIQKLISEKEKLKTKSISDKTKLFNENEITDLLEIILNSRINYLQFHINSQQRKGVGGDGKGTGMPDLSTSIGLNDVTIEAVRVYSTDNNRQTTDKIVDHINKAFNYSTSKYAFYNIVYYEKTDFDDGWSIFKNIIINECDFDMKYAMVGDIKDLSTKFKNEAIKVGITEHKNGLRFYHIYLDFRYVNKNLINKNK